MTAIMLLTLTTTICIYFKPVTGISESDFIWHCNDTATQRIKRLRLHIKGGSVGGRKQNKTNKYY